MKNKWKSEPDKISSQVIASWCDDSSSGSNESEKKEDIPIITVEEKVVVSGVLLTLMEDIDESKDKLTTFHDIQKYLEEYSLCRLISLTSILIDSLSNLVKDKKGSKRGL